MLVLSRKVGEKIFIGPEGEIIVEVKGINKGVVRLGIEASIDIPVNRQEVHEALQQQNKKTENG